MKQIFKRFQNRVIQLTFRLLPSTGETPWMMTAHQAIDSVAKHTNPFLEKMTVEKPWFSKKKEKDKALDDIAAAFISEEIDADEDAVLQAATDDSGETKAADINDDDDDLNFLLED